MYNKSLDSSMVVSLHIYSNYLAKFSRVIDQTHDRKGKNVAIKEFMKNLKAKRIKAKEMVNSCEQYLAGEMNDVCLALELLEEQKKIEKQQNQIKDEKISLVKILKEADQLTITKCFSDEKKTMLKELVSGKEINHLTNEFNEIEKIVERAVVGEINPLEANQRFQNVLSHLKFLGEYLK